MGDLLGKCSVTSEANCCLANFEDPYALWLALSVKGPVASPWIR